MGVSGGDFLCPPRDSNAMDLNPSEASISAATVEDSRDVRWPRPGVIRAYETLKLKGDN